MMLVTAYLSQQAYAEILYTCEEAGHKTFRSSPCEGNEVQVRTHNMDRHLGAGVASPTRPARRARPENVQRRAPVVTQSTGQDREMKALNDQLQRREELDLYTRILNIVSPPKLKQEPATPGK